LIKIFQVKIDINETYETMVGFGAGMTGSSAYLIFHHSKRTEIMNRLFAPINLGGVGISMLRIPPSLLSDFMAEPPYTYVDDWDRRNFYKSI
jgi:glucosylceramidase